MEYCYLHPDVQASGQCYECKNWICQHDYNLLEEKVEKESEVVVLCPNCYDIHKGLKPEHVPQKIVIKPKKVLMCFQCGEKLSETDKVCPSCGESTEDELYDANHPLAGVRSAKRI